MNDFLKYVMLCVGLVFLFYALWINGYITLQSKFARLFVGSLGYKNKSKATFSSCSGYTKRVIKFRDSRSYEVCFNSYITKGIVTAEIQNRNKEIILQLDQHISQGYITTDSKERYYLIFRFEKADGHYEFTWN